MSTWKVFGEQRTTYEVTVEADSEYEAEGLAREAIMEGRRPPGVLDYWDNEEPLELTTEIIEPEVGE